MSGKRRCGDDREGSEVMSDKGVIKAIRGGQCNDIKLNCVYNKDGIILRLWV